MPTLTTPGLRLPPIKFGAIHLTVEGVTIQGKPAFSDFESALACASYLEERSPFWKARLFAYARTRPDWEKLINQVIDAGRYTKRSVDEYVYVANNVPPENVVEGVSFSHHHVVSSLPSGDQRQWLETAKTEHLSTAELRRKIRKSKRVTVLRGQAKQLADLQAAIQDAAESAAEACYTIPRQDATHGEQYLSEARNHLDTCEEALMALRKLAGTP